jgi:hypothetical protein
MIETEKKRRLIRLAKDVVFVAIALFIMARGRTLGFILGLLFAYWYGRDAWFQLKAIRQENNYRGPEPSSTGAPQRPTTETPADDGKITITDLSNAKDAEFTKE